MVWAGECFDAAACTSDGQALTRATFAYDPHGRRFEKAIFTGTGTPVSTTQFFHDGDVLLAEFYQGTRSDGSGDTGTYPYRIWHHAGTRPVRVQTLDLSGAITSQQALMLDWQGSVVAAVDETSGQLMDRYRYSPYGLPTEAAGLPIRYTGHYYDAELGEAGLYYARARVYDPLTGRFHQTDPIGYEDDLNWYAYVKNDPVNGIDPTGKFVCGGLCIAGVVAIVSAGVSVAADLIVADATNTDINPGDIAQNAVVAAATSPIKGIKTAGNAAIAAGNSVVSSVRNGDSIGETVVKATGSATGAAAGSALGNTQAGKILGQRAAQALGSVGSDAAGTAGQKVGFAAGQAAGSEAAKAAVSSTIGQTTTAGINSAVEGAGAALDKAAKCFNVGSPTQGKQC